MKLRAEQLDAHLAKTLAPVYVISGDEPLLEAEIVDRIRAAARARGFTDREVLAAEPGFDWSRLAAVAGNRSLFGGRTLIELRLPGGKPGDAGARELMRLAEHPSEETLLVVRCPRLDAAAQRTRWYKALEAAGAAIAVYPVERARLPDWIARRMRARGLEPTPEVVSFLAERVEGNLLAAAQEIEKLLLLHGEGRPDLETVTRAVTDSARFSVFDLADAALEGNPARVARILAGVRAEGTEAVLVLWSLAREVRTLARVAHAVEAGATPARALAEERVWDRRKPLVGRALRRLPAAGWQRLLRACARIDRIVKGAEAGDAWQELLQLALAVAGAEPFGAAAAGRARGGARRPITGR